MESGLCHFRAKHRQFDDRADHQLSPDELDALRALALMVTTEDQEGVVQGFTDFFSTTLEIERLGKTLRVHNDHGSLHGTAADPVVAWLDALLRQVVPTPPDGSQRR